MSIAAGSCGRDIPTAQGADRPIKAGEVVVASIGNSGANGLYSASAPGVGTRVIGVPSFDNTHANLAAFSISPTTGSSATRRHRERRRCRSPAAS